MHLIKEHSPQKTLRAAWSPLTIETSREEMPAFRDGEAEKKQNCGWKVQGEQQENESELGWRGRQGAKEMKSLRSKESCQQH